jgi:hypothetical protein
MKKLLTHPFVRGMVKALDLPGTYDAYTGRGRVTRTADDLRTPSFQDDIRHMRGDFNRVGGDMREALRKRK